MEKVFSVLMENKKIGEVRVKKEGLYYSFYSFIRPVIKRLYKLMATCGAETMDLGVYVPNSDGFELFKKVPIRNFKDDEFTFSAVSKSNSENYIPVSEDQVFLSLELLENSRFVVRNGLSYIVIHRKQ